MKESEAAVEAVPPLEDDDCDFQDESQSDDEQCHSLEVTASITEDGTELDQTNNTSPIVISNHYNKQDLSVGGKLEKKNVM